MIKLTVTNEWFISVNRVIVGLFASTAATLHQIKIIKSHQSITDYLRDSCKRVIFIKICLY